MFLERLFRRWDKEPEKPEVESRALQEFMQSTNAKGIPGESIIDMIGDRNNLVSIVILLSYIRHYLNTGKQGDITIKIGYNKPPTCPFSFSVNEESVEDIYPGETLEIN